MKILVCVKRVVDPYVRIRLKSDHSGVDLTNTKMSMNPFDEIAMEAAVRFKEAAQASEVVALSVGPSASQETLRTALALGADRAIHVQTDLVLEPLNIAKILKVMTQRESPQLVLMGKQSIDGDNNQTGQMLAALLNWGQATFASALKIEGSQILITREVDGGLQTLQLPLPAVVTVDLRLAEPRYPSLPNIMKAKQKSLESMPLDALQLDLRPHVETISITPPPVRKAGIRVNSVQELVEKLTDESKVI